MPKHLFLLIIWTFVIGLVSGVYGFFMTRGDDTVMGSIVDTRGYEVLITMYGGCERVGCTSLRLLDDGSYTYLSPQGIREYTRHEDQISELQEEILTDLIEDTPFEVIQNEPFMGTCPVLYDGIAYRFDLRVREMSYSFDSCVTNLEDEPLFMELIKFMDIMKTTYDTP